LKILRIFSNFTSFLLDFPQSLFKNFLTPKEIPQTYRRMDFQSFSINARYASHIDWKKKWKEWDFMQIFAIKQIRSEIAMHGKLKKCESLEVSRNGWLKYQLRREKKRYNFVSQLILALRKFKKETKKWKLIFPHRIQSAFNCQWF
jgi:hypothetical protein